MGGSPDPPSRTHVLANQCAGWLLESRRGGEVSAHAFVLSFLFLHRVRKFTKEAEGVGFEPTNKFGELVALSPGRITLDALPHDLRIWTAFQELGAIPAAK
jgi:hypothetical protein